MADIRPVDVGRADLPARRVTNLVTASVFPLAATGLAVAFLVGTGGLKEEARRFPDALAIITLVTAALALILLAIDFFRGRALSPESDGPNPHRVAFWSYWAALVAWPALIATLGFFTASALLGITLSVLTRPWATRPTRADLAAAVLRSALVVIVVVVIVYVLATVLLGIRFPHGLFI